MPSASAGMSLRSISADLDEAHCQQLRERIRQMLSQPFYLEGQVLHVGVSCGYAAYPRDSSRATGGPQPGRPTYVRPKRGTPSRRSGQRPAKR